MRHGSSSSLVILKGVIALKDDCVILMAAAAIQFAKTLDVFKTAEPTENQIKNHIRDCGPQGMNRSCTSVALSAPHVVYIFREDYGGKMFLLPVIFDEIIKVKHWKVIEKDFMSSLAERLRPLWKKTLDDLRALEGTDALPKYHLLTPTTLQWNTLGTLVGIHRLVEPIFGCCYADCSSFIVETNESFGRCSACHQVQYCGTACRDR